VVSFYPIAQIWVRIPLLSAESPGTTIYVWYHSANTPLNQPAPTDPIWGSYGVYDSNYKAVWHMEASGIDSTVNQNTLTPVGGTPTYATGAFPGSNCVGLLNTQNYPGTTYLQCPVIGIPNSAFTVESLQWHNGYLDFAYDTVNNYYNNQAQYAVGTNYWQRWISGPMNSPPTSWPLGMGPSGGTYDLWQTTEYPGGPFGWDTYFYAEDGQGGANSYDFVLNGIPSSELGGLNFYQQGSPVNVPTSALQYTNVGGGFQYPFNGYLDEVRISNIARSQGYAITMAYNITQILWQGAPYQPSFANAGTPQPAIVNTNQSFVMLLMGH
jgi:hypothetical protein